MSTNSVYVGLTSSVRLRSECRIQVWWVMMALSRVQSKQTAIVVTKYLNSHNDIALATVLSYIRGSCTPS